MKKRKRKWWIKNERERERERERRNNIILRAYHLQNGILSHLHQFSLFF